MQKKTSIYFILPGIIILVLTSCQKLFDEENRRGEIEYKITYLENNFDNLSANLMPKKMKLVYNDHLSKNSIESFMGIFVLSSISNTKDATNVTLLKFMDNKFYHETSKNEHACFFYGFNDIEISFTDGTREIAGFKCKKAIAEFPDNDHPGFDIYYTEEIPIKNPNKNTPFEKIDGVLMEFQMKMDGLEMKLTADSYNAHEIPDEEFDIPTQYHPISKDKMQEIIAALLQ